LHYLRAGDAERWARKLSECARIADLSGTPFDGSALLAGLRAAVDFAWYWQEPDDEDQGFAGEAAREALRPIAEAVVAAAGTPDAHWWTEPVDRSRQRYTQFLDQHPLPEPLLTGAAEFAGAWLADTLDDERSAHDRPEDPAASCSGHWWSTRAHSRLPVTTRGRPALGAVRLVLVEDGLGWRWARCWPVAPEDGARVYEVCGPGQLAEAGIAIPAGDGACTMLAGWDPDATWWLNDVLSLTSPPEDWREDNQAPFGWTRTPQP